MLPDILVRIDDGRFIPRAGIRFHCPVPGIQMGEHLLYRITLTHCPDRAEVKSRKRRLPGHGGQGHRRKAGVKSPVAARTAQVQRAGRIVIAGASRLRFEGTVCSEKPSRSTQDIAFIHDLAGDEAILQRIVGPASADASGPETLRFLGGAVKPDLSRKTAVRIMHAYAAVRLPGDPADIKIRAESIPDGPGHINAARIPADLHDRFHGSFRHDAADDDFPAVDVVGDFFFTPEQNAQPAVALTVFDPSDPVISVVIIVVVVVVVIGDAAEIGIPFTVCSHRSRVTAMCNGSPVMHGDPAHVHRRTARRNKIDGAGAVGDRSDILQDQGSGHPVAEGFEIHIDRPGDPQVLDGPVVPVKQRDMIARFRLKVFDRMTVAVKRAGVIPVGPEGQRLPVDPGQVQVLHENVIRGPVLVPDRDQVCNGIDSRIAGRNRGFRTHVLQQVQVMVFRLCSLLGIHLDRRH